MFVTGIDPVAAGIVTSFNRPGGNVTGVSFLTGELMPKRLEILHELVPGVGTIRIGRCGRRLERPSSRETCCTSGLGERGHPIA